MEHDEMYVYQKISLFPRDFGHVFGERSLFQTQEQGTLTAEVWLQ